MSRGGATGEGGQSTVELALVLPLVALAALLVVQVGLVVRDVVLVNHAAREAARAAAVDADPDTAGRAAGRAGPLAPDRLQVRVQRGHGPDRSVEVDLRYRSVTEVPLIGWLLPDVTVEAIAVMHDEQAGSGGVGLGQQRLEHGDRSGLVEGLVAVAALG